MKIQFEFTSPTNHDIHSSLSLKTETQKQKSASDQSSLYPPNLVINGTNYYDHPPCVSVYNATQEVLHH